MGRALPRATSDTAIMLPALSLAAAALVGSFPIGHTSVSWPDPARANRLVTAELYYPAQMAGDGAPVAAPPPGGFPVLAFGHGYLMPAARYGYLWEALVPRGYVLALPTTGGELFPDHQDFALDLAFLTARLVEEGATPGSIFEGAISELGAVGGHSMGGGASVLAASYDPAVDAVLNLAAADTNPSAIAAAPGVLQPSLMLAGSDDCVTPIPQHQRPIHAALASACKLLVVLDGASHCQFAEPDFFCNLGESCSASMDEATQQALTAALVGDWLGAVLGGDGEAWAGFQAGLTGPEILSVEGGCDPGPLNCCTSLPNSTGAPAVIGFTGSASVSAGDLVLLAAPLPANQPGVFYYGPEAAEVPFGNGLRCVGPGATGFQRLPVETTDASGLIQHALDYAAPPTPQGAIEPGSTWRFQCWYRDPAAGGASFDLSDALLVTFGP